MFVVRDYSTRDVCNHACYFDGGWWPYTPSVAKELPELCEALERPLGPIVDIGVNWSPLEGVPDLDSLNYRGNAAVRSRKPVVEDPVFGLRAAGPALLSNVSYFEQRQCKWDPETMTAG